jgi:hypothetical protein
MHDRLTALQQQFDSFRKNSHASAGGDADRRVQVHVDVQSVGEAETGPVGLESIRVEMAAVTEKMVKLEALERLMQENRDQLQVRCV